MFKKKSELKNKFIIILSALLFFALFVSITMSLRVVSLENFVEEQKEKNEAVNRRIEALGNDVYYLYRSVDGLNESLNDEKDRVEVLGIRIAELEEKVKKRGIVAPSFEELKKFVDEDYTETLEYEAENNTFICTDFANTFVKNFRERGYYSCLAVIYLLDDYEDKEGAHSIVAVKTSDVGLVYVEPQNDKIIFSLKVGEDYCSKMNWNCRWIITNIKSCF